MREAPRLSAVVCTHGRYPMLGGAIASLLAQECAPGFLEILVIDNSPNQQEAERFGARYDGAPALRYLLEPISGLSHARNRGLAEARADLIAYIDDDAIASKRWAGEIAAAFGALGKAALVVGGRTLPRFVSPRPPWLHDTLLGYLSVVDWGGPLRFLGEREWIAGSNIAFRRSDALAAGGFNEGLGRKGNGSSLMSNEENRLIAELRAGGGKVGYAPEALVEHVIDPTRLHPAWFRRRAAWQAVSDVLSEAPTGAIGRAQAHVRLVAQGTSRAERAPRLGVYSPSTDFAVVSEDIGAAYDLVLTMLCSGGVDTDPAVEPAPHALDGGRLRAFLLRHPGMLAWARAVRRRLL